MSRLRWAYHTYANFLAAPLRFELSVRRGAVYRRVRRAPAVGRRMLMYGERAILLPLAASTVARSASHDDRLRSAAPLIAYQDLPCYTTWADSAYVRARQGEGQISAPTNEQGGICIRQRQ